MLAEVAQKKPCAWRHLAMGMRVSERDGAVKRVAPMVKGISMACVFLVPALVWVGGLGSGLSRPAETRLRVLSWPGPDQGTAESP